MKKRAEQKSIKNYEKELKEKRAKELEVMGITIIEEFNYLNLFLSLLGSLKLNLSLLSSPKLKAQVSFSNHCCLSSVCL